jgi:cytochrome c oxidase subunit 2
VLLCNKICGAAHYNMQLPLIVTKGADYDAWYAELVKKPFEAPAAPATPVVAPDAQAALNYN